jgi:hypothetical protein
VNTRLATYVTSSTTAISVSRVKSAALPLALARKWNTAGTVNPIALSSSMVEPRPAAVRLKRWTGCLMPPTNAHRPKTSSTLPMIEPVSDALTRSVSPRRSARAPMISSGGIAECGVEQSAKSSAEAAGKYFRRSSDVARQRKNRYR